MLEQPVRSIVESVYCLKIGKHAGHQVDQAEQESAQDRDEAQRKDFLRCAACHYPVAHKTDRIAVNEKHQHVFANPHGYIYRIGCFSRAPGCLAIGEESTEFAWFPGYTWQVVLCGHCLTLLGWSFRARESLFFGLILDKLTEEPSQT